MSDQPLIPSAMSPGRLLLMQQRAECGEPLAQRADSDGVTASIQRRGKKVAKNGYFVAARAVGQGSKNKTQTTREARFDDDGEEYEKVDEFTLIDAYLDTRPGTRAAAETLSAVLASRGR